jgi:hypothetical protein
VHRRAKLESFEQWKDANRAQHSDEGGGSVSPIPSWCHDQRGEIVERRQPRRAILDTVDLDAQLLTEYPEAPSRDRRWGLVLEAQGGEEGAPRRIRSHCSTVNARVAPSSSTSMVSEGHRDSAVARGSVPAKSCPNGFLIPSVCRR